MSKQSQNNIGNALCAGAFVLTMALVAVSCSQADTGATTVDPRQQSRDKVQQAFAPLVSSNDSGNIYNQIAVGVITGDNVDFYGFYDKANPDLKVTKDSLFELGASTQVFTALAYADLLAKNKIGIYDTVDSVVTKTKIPTHGDEKIKIEQLASHFSQLPWLPTNLGAEGPLTLNPFKLYTEDKFDAFLSDYKLSATPGRDFRYSVTGMGLLGKVLSTYHGKTLPEVMKATIFDELGMPNTRYALSAEQQERLVQGHFNGLPVAPWEYNALKGAGGLKSSVADLVTFLKAQIKPKGSAMAATIEKSQEPRGQYPLGTMAMGWQIAGRNLPFYYWTAGYTSGSQSYIAFMPRQRRGIIVLANSVFPKPSDATAYWLRIHELASQIMDEISNRPDTE